MIRRFFVQDLRICGIFRAFIPAPIVPEIRTTAQIFPFLRICNGYSVADIAAKWLAARVMDAALFAAIE